MTVKTQRTTSQGIFISSVVKKEEGGVVRQPAAIVTMVTTIDR